MPVKQSVFLVWLGKTAVTFQHADGTTETFEGCHGLRILKIVNRINELGHRIVGVVAGVSVLPSNEVVFITEPMVAEKHYDPYRGGLVGP